jgi:murein DD-endopeptidase MepM/ murein hydrolase activator NlpD
MRSEETQQLSKPYQYPKQHSSSRRLLFLAALSLVGVSTLGGLHKDWAGALQAQAVQIVSRNPWQGGSFPVENFLAYTSGFGYRSSATGGGGMEFHSGLDIAAPEGSYIRNWWTGQVIEVSDDTACGTLIKIRSGDWTHVYCHMKGHVEKAYGRRYIIDREGGLQIWEGQQLPSGARIGRVGMTGRTTGPHLHWGVKYANQYVDPAQVLRAMYNQQISTGSASSYTRQRD